MQDQKNEITLRDIFGIIRKNIIMIFVLTAVIVCLGFVYTFVLVDEKYEASSTIVVAVTETSGATDGVDYTNGLKITTTVAQLCKEDIVLIPVAEIYAEYEVKDIREMLTITYLTNSYLITIKGVSSDKENIASIVDDVAESLLTQCADEDNVGLYQLIGTSLQQTTKAEDLGVLYYSPNKVLYIFVSLLIGLVASFIVALFKELFSTKFRSKKDVEANIQEQIIGIFFNDRKKEMHNGSKKDVNVHISSKKELAPYNNLITNIRYSSFDKEHKVIMITSSVMNELKSTQCVNLGVCMASNDKRVLIIDLDLRKPVIHRAFKVSREKGIVDYASKKYKLEDIIKKTEYNVDVITAGDDIVNPANLLESEILKGMIKELREKYDYILIDTPPISACADALIISKDCDGVLYNIAMNSTKKTIVKEAINRLHRVNANIIGIVLTKYSDKMDTEEYYYYYYNNEYTEKVSN